MTRAAKSRVSPEWRAPGRSEVPDLLGAAAYGCPPEWASEVERQEMARALVEWSDGDEEFLSRGCMLARRRLAAGRVRRDVVQLLERALTLAHGSAEPERVSA